ncbi:hypothetical protein [Tumidithrix helvetica]|uniref:hypothetical protein n=1 Tax=Tumidithrix helvetica TaxID=3457545 RepID=UPI003CC6A182
MDTTNASIDVLGTKLATVMEISALLLLGLRITSSFRNAVILEPAYLYYSYLGLKLSACASLAIAIAIAIFGIYPRKITPITPPSVLMLSAIDSEESLKQSMIENWTLVLGELKAYKEARAEMFRKSVIALGIGAFFAAIMTTDAFVMAMASKL